MGGAGTDTVNITTSLSDAPGASADIPTDSKGTPADPVAEPSAPGECEVVSDPSASASTPAFPSGPGNAAPLDASEQPAHVPPASSQEAAREGEEPSVGDPTSDSSKQDDSATSSQASPPQEGGVPDVNTDKVAEAQGPTEERGKQDAEGEPVNEGKNVGDPSIPTAGAQDAPAEAQGAIEDATESMGTLETTKRASTQKPTSPSVAKGDIVERASGASGEQKPGAAPTGVSSIEETAAAVKQEASAKQTSRPGNGAVRPSQPLSKTNGQKPTKALGGMVLPPRPSELEEHDSTGVPGAFSDNNPFSMRSPEKLESPSWWPF
ncbi:hypothetical protein C8Q79DRAFT_1011095 [Trametes meyenii]|nr:hypothetical protein C8Q79DRAFT_1011095 [Trametes meyenii]